MQQAFSKIWIMVVLVVFVAGGILAWQYFGVPEEVKEVTSENYVPDQVIVKFKPGTPIEAEVQLNQNLGTTVVYISPDAGFKVLQIPKGKTVSEMVDIYSKQSIVEYAEPNYIDRIDLPPTEAELKENYCEKDADCACGVNINTRDCFYGNKDYVDTTQQCPDFCTGITGKFIIKCINNECEQVSSSPNK